MNKKDLDRISEQVSRQLRDARVSQETINNIVYRLAVDNPTSPWWVVALKVLAYAIGLILAGVGTSVSAATLFIH